MGLAVKSEGERRQDECPYVLRSVDPAQENGFRWNCIKCGKWMYRKNGVVSSDAARALASMRKTRSGGRPVSCECGECRKCKMREYQRNHRLKMKVPARN